MPIEDSIIMSTPTSDNYVIKLLLKEQIKLKDELLIACKKELNTKEQMDLFIRHRDNILYALKQVDLAISLFKKGW